MSVMSKSKYPWKLVAVNKGFGQPFDYIITDADGTTLAGVFGDLKPETTKTNAILMKEAPMLHEALVTTKKVIETFGEFSDEELARARGIIQDALNILLNTINGTLEQCEGKTNGR